MRTDVGNGGVSAVAFDSEANITDAYSILSGTSRNCAGGPTPWGTWLSCEEHSGGKVHECDPYTPSSGVARSAMGIFTHEAAAVDPVNETIYLTEDTPSGKLYRFSPASYPDLSSGTLETAQIAGGSISPGQVKNLSWTTSLGSGTSFNGGEGCWYESGLIYFTTKGDWRVWKIDTTVSPHTIEIYYNGTGSLTEPDNVYAAGNGDVYVAEDDGNLEIVALTQSGGVLPIMRLTGVSGTEITGPALNQYGDRLYFSSQRNPGRTYEITGPFQPPSPVPAMGPLAQGGPGRGLRCSSPHQAAQSTGHRACRRVRERLQERRASLFLGSSPRKTRRRRRRARPWLLNGLPNTEKDDRANGLTRPGAPLPFSMQWKRGATCSSTF